MPISGKYICVRSAWRAVALNRSDKRKQDNPDDSRLSEALTARDVGEKGERLGERSTSQ